MLEVNKQNGSDSIIYSNVFYFKKISAIGG